MSISKRVIQKLKKIKVIVSDVDGVLTDGRIYLPSEGGEIKVFHSRDAFRIEVLVRSGIPMVWFTGRKAQATARRGKELGVDVVFKKDIGGKLFDYIAKKYKTEPEEILYIGDDWSDLYLMKNCGVSVAPNNAAKENKTIAEIITKTNGGEGVLAEIIEILMRANGTWNKYSKEYLEKFIF